MVGSRPLDKRKRRGLQVEKRNVEAVAMPEGQSTQFGSPLPAAAVGKRKLEFSGLRRNAAKCGGMQRNAAE